MTETYQVESKCLELFETAARYSEQPSVETLTSKLIEVVSNQKINHEGAKKYTREEIKNLLAIQRKAYQVQKENEERNKKDAKDKLTTGGIVIAGMGAAGGLLIGNVISIAALTGVMTVTAIGGIMAVVGNVTQLKIDIKMPDKTRIRFESLNKEYDKPLSIQ